MYQQRHQRLTDDNQLLQELAASSSILSFESSGEAPERYTLILHGKGPTTNTAGQIEVADVHRCVLRLPFGYPQTAPDVQWLTPLFHPNVGYGGFMHLEDVGLEWHADMGLDVVCERLWDVARMAYVNEHNVVNSTALGYLPQSGWNLPLDDRPLRDRVARQVKNIVRYKRRPDAVANLDAILQESSAPLPREDVLYIGDEENE